MRLFASIFAICLAIGLVGCSDEAVKKETKIKDSAKAAAEDITNKVKAGAEKAVDETKKVTTEAVDKAKAGAENVEGTAKAGTEKAVDGTKKVTKEAVDKAKAGAEKLLNDVTPDAPKKPDDK
jgi:hypothetical protein